jgi:hypothetical protein
MALPPLELPPIEKGRPVAGRPFYVVEKGGPNWEIGAVGRVTIAVGDVGFMQPGWLVRSGGGVA